LDINIGRVIPEETVGTSFLLKYPLFTEPNPWFKVRKMNSLTDKRSGFLLRKYQALQQPNVE
jgi:hypothetical protein